MDTRDDERAGAPLHGRHGRLSTPLRLAVLPLVAAALLAGIAGGLVRFGIAGAWAAGAVWPLNAAAGHPLLMVCGFFGTVIAVERATALALPAAWAAPLLSAAGALLVLLGREQAGAWMTAAAGAAFVAVHGVLLRRQRLPHTIVLTIGACAWTVGSAVYALVFESTAAWLWWFAFLVLTIAAERLELTRLMPRRPRANALLALACAVLVAGAALATLAWVPGTGEGWGAAGGTLFGCGLLALAAWLGAFDVARRTVRVPGLTRYMALCLLSGYAWMAVAGLAWIAIGAGVDARDAAVHALGLGFVFSMVMGHAPVILPAVAGVRLRYSTAFYAPLALLHATLLLRLAPLGGSLQAAGAVGNALAVALFAATVVAAALAARQPVQPVAADRSNPAPGAGR